MAAYFTLVTRDTATDKWEIQFGDYDRECVAYEADEYPDTQTKIIRTADSLQKTIQAAVDKLNGDGNWR